MFISNKIKMKELLKILEAIVLTVAFIYFGTNHAKKNELKHRTDKMANEMYKDSLERAYIFKTKALRIYMPIALKNQD